MAETKSAGQKVYKAITLVSKDLAESGIAKNRKNQQQGYSFRGIDDVFNALAPILAKHQLVILPRYVERTCTERQSRGGGSLFGVVVKGELDFVSAEDGSKHTVVTFGEAMDSADKATNKAMSAAYKYAAFQVFCIPVEGVHEDGDAETPEVAVPSQAKVKPKSTPATTVELATDQQRIELVSLLERAVSDSMRDAIGEALNDDSLTSAKAGKLIIRGHERLEEEKAKQAGLTDDGLDWHPVESDRPEAF